MSDELKEFVVIEYDGIRCVMESHEAEALLDETESEYTVSTVMLTIDEFEGMPEFEGF